MRIVIPVKKPQIVNTASGAQVDLTDRRSPFPIDHLDPRISSVALPPCQ